jgi:hypothetical protein
MSEFLYHITPTPNLHQILEQGLKPHSDDDISIHGGIMVGSELSRICLTVKGGVKGWESALRHRCQDLTVLQIKLEDLDTTLFDFDNSMDKSITQGYDNVLDYLKAGLNGKAANNFVIIYKKPIPPGIIDVANN